MSLNVHPHVIAEPRIAGFFGERGVGVSTLKFSIEFQLANVMADDDVEMRIDTFSAAIGVVPTSGRSRYGLRTQSWTFPGTEARGAETRAYGT